MAWARLDEEFHDSREVDGLSLAAVGLYTLCLTWAIQWREDNPEGQVPLARVRMLAGHRSRRLGAELVSTGLWIESGKGWRIADFADRFGGAGDRDRMMLARIRRRDRIAFRQATLDRDGHRCIRCGATDDLTLDHIVPLKLSRGPRGLDDLATLCRSCNSRKGARVDG